jgi:hypothetical protein
MKRTLVVLVAVLAAFAIGVAMPALGGTDFGLQRDAALRAQSQALFGITAPVGPSSTASIDAGMAAANPLALVTLAKGLRARVITSGVAAPNIDQITLWPNDTNPQWLIACNEEGTAQPGLQGINLATGAVETILTGTTSCDPTRRTPWGTLLFGEEAGGGAAGGRVYELLDPLAVSGVSLDRVGGVFSGGTVATGAPACPSGGGDCYFAVRPFLGRLSYEGFGIYDNGPVYYGGEDRPLNGAIGGAFFKFVPTCALTTSCPSSLVGPTPVDRLAQSPLAHGTVYGLRLGRRSGNTDDGQGANDGLGTWVTMGAADTELDLRALSTTGATTLTGYYRPEDIDLDRVALANGQVRWCVNNTGNESQDHLWGESVCLTDGSISDAVANAGSASPAVAPELQPFVVGTPDFAMMDNIAYQPGRGNWVMHEDGDGAELSPPKNNDLFDCLPDGGDQDQQSDGCVKIGTLNDLTAEWTGGVFDATGTRFFVSVQHNISGFGVVLEITGWR